MTRKAAQKAILLHDGSGRNRQSNRRYHASNIDAMPRPAL